MNSIMILFPYNKIGVWMFDDTNFNLKDEAFVGGMSEMIDRLIEKCKINYSKSFLNLFLKRKIKITFSVNPFPEYQMRLDWEYTPDYRIPSGMVYDSQLKSFIHTYKREKGDPKEVGNWYEWNEEGMKGWLCPALFHYFEETPKTIYVKVENI